MIKQAIPPPHPRFQLVFSAFSVGLFANAVLPGRIGELARVAVLTRKLRLQGRADGTWAALVGTVFAHRLFDLVPVVGLILYVVATTSIPHWAITSLVVVGAVGFGLFAFAFASARREQQSVLDELGPVQRLVDDGAATGSACCTLRGPPRSRSSSSAPAGSASSSPSTSTMRAFDIHAPLHSRRASCCC